MKVALCHTKQTASGKHILSCFEDGLKAHGDTAVHLKRHNDKEIRDCDVAVQVCFFNILNKGKSSVAVFRQSLLESCTFHKRRLLTIDTGFVSNQHELDMRNAVDRSGTMPFDTEKPETFTATQSCIYYEMGFDGLKRHASYYNENSPADRWTSLGVPIQPWRHGGKYILVLGQTLYGSSSAHVDVFRWYHRVCQDIRRQTSRPIVFRHHPRRFKNSVHVARVEDTKSMRALFRLDDVTVSNRVCLKDDLQHAHCAVVFTSNAGVTSVLAGVPTFVGDNGCMAWDVGNTDFNKIEEPDFPAREEWAYNLAYAQWNRAEMESGEAWAHLRPHSKKDTG